MPPASMALEAPSQPHIGRYLDQVLLVWWGIKV